MFLEPLAPTRARGKISSKSKATKWSQEEDDRLLQFVQTTPAANWTDLTSLFPGKTAQQLSERWTKVLNPDIIRGKWTGEEDAIIIRFVEQNGPKSWSKLKTILPGRTGKQCRERWRDHLDPNVNRSPFTEEEDRILIMLHGQFGNQWVKIAQHLPGRSDNAIKNRWNATLKKRLARQAMGTPPPKRGRPSLKRIPKSADDVPKPKMDLIPPDSTVVTPRGIDNGALQLSPYQNIQKFFGSPVFSWTQNDSPLFTPKQLEGDDWGTCENKYETANLLSPTLFGA